MATVMVMVMVVIILVKTVKMECPQVGEGLRELILCKSYKKLQVLCSLAITTKVIVVCELCKQQRRSGATILYCPLLTQRATLYFGSSISSYGRATHNFRNPYVPIQSDPPEKRSIVNTRAYDKGAGAPQRNVKF